MKLFEEHNSDYALRVGVNRSATSYYHYTNTYRHLATFLKDKYHLSDMPVKQMDENFIEDFDMYMRTVKRFMPKTILGHVNRLKSVRSARSKATDRKSRSSSRCTLRKRNWASLQI